MISGAAWRAEQDVRVAQIAGWSAAILSRQKRIPKLTKFLGVATSSRRKPPTAEQQAAVILALHAQFGGKLIVHDPAEKGA